MKTKLVSHFYRSSPTSEKWRMPQGGYAVSTRAKQGMVDKVIAVFADIQSAYDYAETLPYEYDRYDSRTYHAENMRKESERLGGVA